MNNLGLGINVIGYIDGEFGLGEAVRLNLKAMESVDLPYVKIDYLKLNKKTINESVFKYNINLIQLSLNDISDFFAKFKASSFLKNRYNILFLVWESEYVPEEIQKVLHLFHEIWTPSSYCCEIFRQHFLGPVMTVPHPVEVELTPLIENDFLKIYDKQKYSFLFIFNFGSSIKRKNTLFLIQSFIEAFPVENDAELIIKCSNAKKNPKDYALVLKEIGTRTNIKLIDIDLDKNDLNHFINQCDCYISLHHSEGFGLTLAESMYLGKPTIATNYSGNLEFMNDQNSFLVDYVTNSIEEPDVNFCEKTIWADPLLADSVNKMRLVCNNRVLASEKAKKAQIDTQNKLSYKSVGSKIAKRVESIIRNFKNSDEDKMLLISYKSRIIELEMELKKIKKSKVIACVLGVKQLLRNVKSKYKKVN
ncbi:glycosyltransferase family 4 protein [Flavobacterium seoulense]|uniref:Protein-N-phosphohistidine-sugar phosphotransferase n=1 Tax=Flavobacterium seoulense TaxID=1492738 RepID=A0A066WQN7_9FLAO|nr:glycosyltransferase family 4 protein [Flavobacterium seoulense]KDN56337.1 protein-N -phosphohistidine-sugar phosphotransferase [Flavobacterium seoulense]